MKNETNKKNNINNSSTNINSNNSADSPISKSINNMANINLVMITGASSGIGFETSLLLLEKGYHVLALARRQDKLEELKKSVSEEALKRLTIYPLDVTKKNLIQDFFALHTPLLTNLTALVNNAGLALGSDPLQNGNPDDWDQMIDTNIKGLLYMTKLSLPYLIKNQGHVVNIGSISGRWVYPGGNVYCATKFAVRAISEGLRMDLMGTGVRVTNIEPGMAETEFSEVRFNDNQKAKQVYQGMTPLTAKDIAETIEWSLSRPKHVNIHEMIVFPTDQAGMGYVTRRD